MIQANFIMAEYSEKTIDYKKNVFRSNKSYKEYSYFNRRCFKSSTFMKSDARIVIAGKAWLDYEIEYEKQ